jgi:uncharacterized protein YndB with AHSA1/START domain
MVRVEIDARVSGAFCFVERRDGEDVEHRGEYLVIDPPRRLKFSFYVDDDRSTTTNVTIDIVSSENGCELTLSHERIPQEYAHRTHGGWTDIVAGLARELDARR